MILKHRVQHRRTFRFWTLSHLKTLLNNGFYPFVPSVDCVVRPVFIVGCGHSGTTLLASRLGKSSSSYLIGRETKMFRPDHGLYPQYLRLNDFLQTAKSSGATVMIEKTPKHVHSFNRIRRLAPDAHFVVMTRNPLDNCASLYRRFGDLRYCVERYRIDNSAALEMLNHTSVTVRMTYETLTTEPKSSLQSVCEFLGIQWEEKMLEAGATPYSNSTQPANMVFRAEQVSQPIRPRIETWRDVFDQKQRMYVASQLQDVAEVLGYDLMR